MPEENSVLFVPICYPQVLIIETVATFQRKHALCQGEKNTDFTALSTNRNYLKSTIGIEHHRRKSRARIAATSLIYLHCHVFLEYGMKQINLNLFVTLQILFVL